MSVSTAGALAIPSEATGFRGAWLTGDETAGAFLPRHPSSREDRRARVAEVDGRAPATTVWARAAAEGERLGADEAALANARALEAGDALCVTTGQQPGLLLGPLYTAYKAMTAVALAQQASERLGRRVVPVFWNAADDSDFAEIAAAVLPDDGLRLVRHKLSGGELPAGGMVGDLSIDGTRVVLDSIREDLGRRESGDVILQHLERALSVARDHGELASALCYDLFAGTGLVVVDGRWAELRREASGLFVRYAGVREDVARDVTEAGERLEASGFPARISEASARSALFDARDRRRLPFEGDGAALAERAGTEPDTLSPNVVLRPLVQDSLFPNLATVAGPGEISYHAQLFPVYERLGVSMPVLFPRFEATLVPRGVQRLAERRNADPAAFVADFDRAMRATAEAAVPAGLRQALDRLDVGVAALIEAVRDEAGALDDKLGSTAEDTRRRVRQAVEKLQEKVAKAVRDAESRRDPAVKSYREFLRPRGVPQERVLGSLALFVDSPAHPLRCLESPLTEHLAAVREGRSLHWLVPFGGCPDEEAS